MIINKYNKQVIKTKLFDINVKKLRGSHFHSKLIIKQNFVYKKFKKYLTLKKKIKCLLCKTKLNYKNIFCKWQKYRLLKCNKCGSICTNIDFDNFKTTMFHNLPEKRKDIKKKIGKNIKYRSTKFGNERIKYIFDNIKLNKRKLKILDYGCGYGSFLLATKKKNIYAKGIDFDDDSIEVCKKLNLNVSKNSINDEVDKSYDIITLFDVIEHLQDPDTFLKNAMRKLKKNGHILLYTPNINSFSNILMGHEHNNFSIFDHVCFYNEQSINFICKKYGLKLIKIDYFGLDIKDYFQKIEHDNKNFNQKILDKFSNLAQSYIDHSKVSNSARIILKKK